MKGISEHIENILQKYTNKSLDMLTAFEVGINTGYYGRLFGNKFLAYEGTDKNKHAVDIGKQDGFEYRSYAIQDLPVDKSYDVVFFLKSFKFMPFRKALEKTKELLNDSGLVVILEDESSSGLSIPRRNGADKGVVEEYLGSQEVFEELEAKDVRVNEVDVLSQWVFKK